MSYLLLHTRSCSMDGLAEALAEEGVDVCPVESAERLAVDGRPAVCLLGPADRDAFPPDRLATFVRDGGAVIVLGRDDERDVPGAIDPEGVSAWIPYPHPKRTVLLALRAALREAAARHDAWSSRREASLRTRELAELTRIGMALSTEHDYDALLALILRQALDFTGSDAGSLYIVEKAESGEPRLRFKLSQNDSRPDIPFTESTMPLDASSIAGNAATTGRPLVIDDVYRLPNGVQYTFNRWFDGQYGYRSRSMLTIPMKDHQDEVIGVLQLINRKRHPDATLAAPADFEREVVPYSQRQVDFVSALAGQAAVSIENSRLYQDIERLFAGFVRASVTAIEQRDPTTFGHSGRVASMTVALAKTVDHDDHGPYRQVSFSRDEIREIRYAGLLHDFGKVGVREQVLVKAKKLHPPSLALVALRHAFIRRSAENEFHRQRMRYLETHGQSGYAEFVRQLSRAHDAGLEELDRFLQLVHSSNEPTVLPAGSFENLLRYAETYYEDLEGKQQPYLTDDEVRFLSIREGSLDEVERQEIENHVSHTYRFLLQIPWTREMQAIPAIAYGHHEKLDGSGYPRKVRAPEIPIQTRMMTIADIFDALTAADRPYKRAVPVLRALDILADEARAGLLDQELFRLFTEARVYERAAESGTPTA
jgi:HD-GYP domain-containing protein (c-di-GMP phosphodiesterase class II)